MLSRRACACMMPSRPAPSVPGRIRRGLGDPHTGDLPVAPSVNGAEAVDEHLQIAVKTQGVASRPHTAQQDRRLARVLLTDTATAATMVCVDTCHMTLS